MTLNILNLEHVNQREKMNQKNAFVTCKKVKKSRNNNLEVKKRKNVMDVTDIMYFHLHDNLHDNT